MKRVARVLLVLACSASGTPAVAMIRHSLHAGHRLPVHRTGVGSKTLGVFVIPRYVHIRASCTSAGATEDGVELDVEFIFGSGSTTLGVGGFCGGADTGLILNSITNAGDFGRHARIKVVAPLGMKWRVTIDKSPNI